MEILKPICLLGAGLFMSLITLSGQSFTETKDAFQQSYIQEATGD